MVIGYSAHVQSRNCFECHAIILCHMSFPYRSIWLWSKKLFSQIWPDLSNQEASKFSLWPPDVESWLIWKDPDAGKDWGQEEMGATEDEMVGWHHRHNGRGFGWTLGVGDGQGGLACCNSWGRTWLSDWTELKFSQWDLGIKGRCVHVVFLYHKKRSALFVWG